MAARRTVLCAAKWQRTALLVRRRSGISGNCRMDVLQRAADGVGTELRNEENCAGQPCNGSRRAAGGGAAAGARARRGGKRIGGRKPGSAAPGPRSVTVARRCRRGVVSGRSGAHRRRRSRGLGAGGGSGALRLRQDQERRVCRVRRNVASGANVGLGHHALPLARGTGPACRRGIGRRGDGSHGFEGEHERLGRRDRNGGRRSGRRLRSRRGGWRLRRRYRRRRRRRGRRGNRRTCHRP